MKFGDYIKIEQKRFGVPNEFYFYKVIGVIKSNLYADVPVTSITPMIHKSGIVPVVQCIQCGVDESVVERYRVCDVQEIPQNHQIRIMTNEE